MATRKELLNLPCSVCGAKGPQRACIPCHKSYHATCVHECGAPNPVPPPPAESGPSPTSVFAPAMKTKLLMKTQACIKCNKFGAQKACEPCQVSYHATCRHECPQNEPAPAEMNLRPAKMSLNRSSLPKQPPQMTYSVPVGILLPTEPTAPCCRQWTCGLG